MYTDDLASAHPLLARHFLHPPPDRFLYSLPPPPKQFRNVHFPPSFSSSSSSSFGCKRLWIYKSTRLNKILTSRANLLFLYVLWCKSLLPTVTVIGSYPAEREREREREKKGTYFLLPLLGVSHPPSLAHLLRQIRSVWLFIFISGYSRCRRTVVVVDIRPPYPGIHERRHLRRLDATEITSPFPSPFPRLL